MAVDGSTSTSARATSTASSAPTAPARPPRCGCCSAWCWPPAATVELLGQADAAARRRRCCPQVGALVEGPAAYPQLSGRANLALFDAMGNGSALAGARGGSTTCSTGSGSAGVDGRPVRAYSLGMRQRLGLAHAAAPPAAAAGARRADERPGPAGHPRDPRRCCWSSTQPAPRSSCPATCSPRSSRCAPASGVLDRGRLVIQDAPRRRCSGHRAHVRPHARRRPVRGRCSTGRSSRTTGALLVRVRRRRRPQRPAGRGRRAGQRARARAAHARGRRARGARPRAATGSSEHDAR